MKSKLTILFLLVFYAYAVAQDNINNDLIKQNIKGKVKTLIEKSYRAEVVYGQIQKGKEANKDSYSFNEQGNLLENIHSNSGNLLWRFIYNYDGKGNLIEKTRYESDGNINWKETYKYNDSGNQTELERLGPNGDLMFKYINTYDEKRNITNKERYGKSGREGHSIKYVYDAQGKLVEENYLKPNQKTDYKFIYKYDAKGNRTELYLNDSKDKVQEKQTFVYDEKGNVLENVIFDAPDFSSRKILFSYNDKGDLISKSRYTTEGQLLEKDTYELLYDGKDNLTLRKSFKFYLGTKETSNTSQYSEFDGKGNWQKEIYYSDDKAQNITEREIEYYRE